MRPPRARRTPALRLGTQRFVALVAALALLTVGLVAGAPAHAQHRHPSAERRSPTATPAATYTVASGDTLSRIAERLGVTAHALAQRNRLHAPYALRPGRVLHVPGVAAAVAEGSRGEGANPRAAVRLSERVARTGAADDGGGRWGRVRNRGVVRLVREFNSEELTVNLRRITPRVARRMEHFLRFPDGRHRAMNPRLLRQLALVSDHFGGRRLHVISGFRPFRHGQWTPHSNHNIGRAVDFRVEGVPNRAVRDFCRTFEGTGCGYYPRSVFIHMDVREQSTAWVDWSRPGQRPQYGREDRPPEEMRARTAPSQPAGPAHGDGDADESLDDVAGDSHSVRTAPPAEHDDAPAAPESPGPSAAP